MEFVEQSEIVHRMVRIVALLHRQGWIVALVRRRQRESDHGKAVVLDNVNRKKTMVFLRCGLRDVGVHGAIGVGSDKEMSIKVHIIVGIVPSMKAMSLHK